MSGGEKHKFKLYEFLSKKLKDGVESSESLRKMKSFSLRDKDIKIIESKETKEKFFSSRPLSLIKRKSSLSVGSPRKFDTLPQCKTILLGSPNSGKTKLCEEIRLLYHVDDTSSPSLLGSQGFSFEEGGKVFKFIDIGSHQNERKFWQKCKYDSLKN